MVNRFSEETDAVALKGLVVCFCLTFYGQCCRKQSAQEIQRWFS